LTLSTDLLCGSFCQSLVVQTSSQEIVNLLHDEIQGLMCSAQKIICRHSSTLQLYWCQTRVHPCTPSFHPVLCSIL